MKHHLTTILLTTGAMLAGCAPMRLGELEKRPPTLEATSSKSVVELGACISDQLKQRRGSVSVVPRPDGETLTYVLAGNIPMMSVSIVDQEHGRKVTTYGPYGLNTKVTRTRLAAVRACV